VDLAKAGNRLAGRYRLDQRLLSIATAETWLALDEKLNRNVTVDLLAASDVRARDVLDAARAAAVVTDPRFQQVLDAVENDGLVYVVKEWVEDAHPLADALVGGPLPTHEATELAITLADAMAGAHESDLTGVALDLDAVLRTTIGQIKIRGLRLDTVLDGTGATVGDDPSATSARAIGAILYASLTARWPLETVSRLPAAPRDNGRPCSPAQVRAGIPHAIDELTMRMLLDPPPRGKALRSPKDIAVALNGLPRHRPEPTTETLAVASPASPHLVTRQLPAAPPAPLVSNAGRMATIAVVCVLVLGLGLLGWQLTSRHASGSTNGGGAATTSHSSTPSVATVALTIKGASVWDSSNGSEHVSQIGNTYNGSTAGWTTSTYDNGPPLAPYKAGTGIIYDLGSVQTFSTATVTIGVAGAVVETRVAPSSMTTLPPITNSAPPGFTKVAAASATSTSVTLTAGSPVHTRYVLIWFTSLPHQNADQFNGPGYRDSIISVKLYS
jgi:hypothetical protein